MHVTSAGCGVARRRYAAFGNNNPGTPGNLLAGGGFTNPKCGTQLLQPPLPHVAA